MHRDAPSTSTTNPLHRIGAAFMSALLAFSALPILAAPVAAASPLAITNVDSPDPVQSGEARSCTRSDHEHRRGRRSATPC